MWRRDSYYRDCPNIKDAEGKTIPIEIETPDSVLFVYNEWYWDDLLGPSESPEDAIIAAIDGEREKEKYAIEGVTFKPFEVHTVAKEVLNEIEYDVFYEHYVNGLAYRKLGKKWKKAHTVIFAIYKDSIAKIRNHLMEHYKE